MSGGLAGMLGLTPDDVSRMLAQRAPTGPQGFDPTGPAPGGLLGQLAGAGLNLPGAPPAQAQPEASHPGGVWSQLGLPTMGGPAQPPAVTASQFEQRFDASPPGEGYGLTASRADALQSGLTRRSEAPQAAPADMPVHSAVPTAGGAPAPSFTIPAQRTPSPGFDSAGSRVTPPAAPSPAPAAPDVASSPAPSEGGGLGLDILSRLGDPRVVNTLLGIGQGLLTTKGFGPGIAAGASYASRLNKDQAATDLAQAEYGIKRQKLAQEAQGQNATVEMLMRGGHSRENATGMVQAAGAGNREALANAMANLMPKTQETPFGWEKRPDGTIAPVTGGPQALDYKRATSQAAAEGAAAGKPDEAFNLSAGQTRYDSAGKPIVSAAPAKPEGFESEMKLRNEFGKNLGSFSDVHDGYGRVIAATKQRQDSPSTVSPASDIGLVFGYMKMLDPGSVVREGEYATAANAAGIPERVRNAYNKAMSGEFLSPEQRQDFVGQAGQLYGTARKTAEGVAERYRGLASHYGVDPERSVYLPEQPSPPTVAQDRTRSGLGGQPATAPTDPLADARAAIARGAPREAVMNRLLQNGINPKGL